ncbi:unnamed protein product [Acanthoscelides obtectus]|uniref:MADF domain-containing protein n=2 Tax=Acanthoscelides obtectus TaxID=200917 RepID=A0A9P0Q1M9_ACAOB|nr:unnamed protein product [Acanthoscelides obtectus]CAK1641619.1 hypothetical protein AOBTE_LOCUS12509 [Acanthoscelides obtectus]
MGILHHRSVRFVDSIVKRDRKLLTCIKTHPVLYDRNHPGYRNKYLKKAAWENIAKKFKNISVKECEAIWRKLVKKYKDHHDMHEPLIETLEEILRRRSTSESEQFNIESLEEDVIPNLFAESPDLQQISRLLDESDTETETLPRHNSDEDSDVLQAVPPDLSFAFTLYPDIEEIDEMYEYYSGAEFLNPNAGDHWMPIASSSTSLDQMPPCRLADRRIPRLLENSIEYLDEAASLPPSEFTRSLNDVSVPMDFAYTYQPNENIDEYYNYFIENILEECDVYPHVFGDVVESVLNNIGKDKSKEVRIEIMKLLRDRMKDSKKR